MPDEVLQGLMHGAVGDDLVDAVAGPAQREAEVVSHAQQLPKVHPCAHAFYFSTPMPQYRSRAGRHDISARHE